MNILITNDDGINSTRLHALVKEMEKEHEVIVVAPTIQRSACGHSITIHDPLYVKEVKIEGVKSRTFSVSGTPADCVKIALERLVDGKLDMIISGINYGLNIGTDVLYSGTVSAAIEGAIYKIPSMAFSMDIDSDDNDIIQASRYAVILLKASHECHIKNDMVINVNFPERIDKGIKGIKVCQLGNKVYSNCYIETIADKDEVGYKLKDENNNASEEDTDASEEDTDVYYIKNRYITITPLHYDLTNYNVIKNVEKWFASTDLE